MNARRDNVRNFLLLLSAIFVLCGGCKKKEPDFDVISLEGKIEKIERTDEETGRITLLYKSEKRVQELTGTGEVNAETEIMINGAAAKLADIRVGDRVRGEVRVDKKGNQKTLTALKIHIDRARPIGE